MNYILQVVRGRSATTTLKLLHGVNSIGRHDDCVIRIRSSQVSRRHCELFESDGKLMVRDLKSSNGTFVNGKKVEDKVALKPGDVLTVGNVTLRIDVAQDSSSRPTPPAGTPVLKPSGDTAEVDAIEVAEDDQEEFFEVSLEDDEPEHLDIIPLDDDAEIPLSPVKNSKSASKTTNESPKAPAPKEAPKTVEKSAEPKPEEDDAVAQFLIDLKLDEDD